MLKATKVLASAVKLSHINRGNRTKQLMIPGHCLNLNEPDRNGEVI